MLDKPSSQPVPNEPDIMELARQFTGPTSHILQDDIEIRVKATTLAQHVLNCAPSGDCKLWEALNAAQAALLFKDPERTEHVLGMIRKALSTPPHGDHEQRYKICKEKGREVYYVWDSHHKVAGKELKSNVHATAYKKYDAEKIAAWLNSAAPTDGGAK